MLEISGSISKLFGNVDTSLIDYEGMVKMPITKDDKCIGYITSVDVENDTWHGKLFAECGAEISCETRQCVSMEMTLR